jgi:ABC-2 type transport system permease protein
MTNYGRLLATQARVSFMLLVQYRLEAAVSFVLTSFWTLSALVPLLVLYSDRKSVGGWSWGEALLVVGWFNVIKGVQSVVVQPSMQQAVEQIHKGTLDFVLMKPADAQILVSMQRFDFRQVNDIVVGLAILGYALLTLHLVPGPLAIAETALSLVCGVAVVYAIWVMVISLAFVFVKVDNLTFLFSSLYDAARWPGSIFRGGFAFVFTFILPLIVMTTYPALALLGRTGPRELGLSVAGAVVFLVVSRWVWKASIGRYTGAGG